MAVKYDRIGTGYNLTRKADAYITSQLLLHLSPKKSGKYLDIGCGTGNYTIELQKNGFQFIGIDPSQRMLRKAKLKKSEVEWKIGSATNPGLPDNSIDGIIASLTIHHWHNLKAGLSELNKVLKPNGRIVIFTSTPEQMKGYWLNSYFPKMLADSITQMPTLEKVKSAMKDSQLELLDTSKYFVMPDLQDLFLYCGKHNPDLYFNAQIRHGISSFSSLAKQIEVENGLSSLKRDINSGEIEDIIKSYENVVGDYLFVTGKKSTSSSL